MSRFLAWLQDTAIRAVNTGLQTLSAGVVIGATGVAGDVATWRATAWLAVGAMVASIIQSAAAAAKRAEAALPVLTAAAPTAPAPTIDAAPVEPDVSDLDLPDDPDVRL